MNTAIRATLLIAIFSVLSKILGLGRWMVFSNRLGAGQESDIYVAAFRFPDLIFNLLILGTLSAAFIPVFVEYLGRDREEAFVVASTIFNITLAVMAFLGFVGFLFSPLLVKILAPGFSAEAKIQTAHLTRILMLSPLLFGLSSVLTSVLHSFKRFLTASMAPLLYNLSIIIGVVFFFPRFGLAGIVWAGVAGAFLHFAIQLPLSLRLGLQPFRNFTLFHPGVRKIARLFLPRIFGIELGQISLLTASVIGSTLAAGGITSFYYAYDLYTVPIGILAVPFALASFPYMSEFFAKRDFSGMKKFFSETTVQILFLVIPVSVIILLLRAQLVRLIFGAGGNTNFSFADTRLTAQALGYFALSLFAQALVPLLARCFYAMQNTLIPVISGFISAAVNIGLAVFFTRTGGADTMALAFSAAIIVHMIIMLAVLHHRLRGLEDEFIILRVVKISVASILMGIATYVTLYLVAPFVDMSTYVGVMIQTLAAFAAALATYFIAGHIVKLPETKQVLVVIKNWFTKFTKPVTSAIVDMFTDIK